MIAGMFLASLLAATGPIASQDDPLVDKTVEITSEGDKLVFTEQGKKKAEAVSLVVGQTVRWRNKSSKPFQMVSVRKIDGTPLFDSGPIEPGKYKDMTIDIELYSKAGGKPANSISVKYHAKDREEDLAEFRLVSAARRGIGRP